MSYKLDLSQLDRTLDESLTQQLVHLFIEGIESGQLEPGEKLPTTRALAAEAGVNHLTAARAYRRLAELGYVTASVGRGTFVRTLTPAAADQPGDDWQLYALPDRPVTYAEQVLSDAFRLPMQADVISLSTGHPAPRLYPAEDLARLAQDVFRDEGGNAIAYLPAEGLDALREEIARHGARKGFASDPSEIVVTSGARQAIDLAARATLEPGDVAVVESPSFVGLLSSLQATGARVIGVPYDEDGFDVDALERVLARHEVKLCALQTACQNPTGRDLSPERRERLAALALERNFFVIEDGVYSDVRFEGEEHRPVRELAPSQGIYLDSLSKVVGGGLRLGWVAARGPVLERIAALKLQTDFHTPTLVQHMAARYLAEGRYEQHLEQTLPFYRERRDALMEALERHLAGEYRAHTPRGGHHVWVSLTRPLDDRALYSEALRHGVSFTPGDVVTAERQLVASLRLSFSLVDPSELDEGVRRLARALRELRRRERLGGTMTVS